MQNQEGLERIAQRFLDEVENKLRSAKRNKGIRKEIVVPVHPEIYAEAVAALEIINQLGKERGVRVEKVNQECNLKYISLTEESEESPNQSI